MQWASAPRPPAAGVRKKCSRKLPRRWAPVRVTDLRLMVPQTTNINRVMTTMSNPVSMLSVYVPPSSLPPPGFGHLVVELVLFLDRVLGWVILRLPLLFAQFLLDLLVLVVLNGVAWYEHSPTYFWMFWLPAVVVSYGSWVLWFVYTAVPWTFGFFWRVVGRRTYLGWLLECAVAFLLRGSLAPPPVSRAEVVPEVSVVGDQLARTRGIAYAQAAGVAHASVTSGGLTPSRVRGRSVWTNRLQAYLGGRPGVIGDLVRGRWVPDLPAAGRPLSVNALLGLADLELKLLGGGVLPTTVLEHEVFLVVETRDGRRVVAPALLAKLCLYACFRPRTPDLLSGLRARAREWFSEKGVADMASAFVLPDTVELAFAESAPERLARGRLGSFEDPPSQ